MKTIRIAGVPEHFNMPWHLGINDGSFASAGINLEWTDVSEGSGKMLDMLEKNEADLVLVLTEAAIKYLHQKPIGKIVQTYVKSPLNWGLHVDYNSPFKHISELENQKIAISRYGSGSHLMSYVLAQQQGWPLSKLQFEVINNLEGAIQSLSTNASQLFLWEKWTTKPWVDQHVFKNIGNLPTPWPCFVLVAKNDLITHEPHLLELILQKINLITEEFKDIPSIEKTIAGYYDLAIDDVEDWIETTEWSQEKLSSSDFNLVEDYLLKLNLIPQKSNYQNMVL